MDAAICIAQIDYQISMLSALLTTTRSAAQRGQMSAEIAGLEAAREGWAKIIARSH